MLFIHFSCFHSSSLQAFVILHLKCWLTAFHLWLKLCIILEVAMVRHDVDFFPPVSISHRVGISEMCRVYVMKPAHWTVKYSKVFCNYTTFSRSSVWIAIDFCSLSHLTPHLSCVVVPLSLSVSISFSCGLTGNWWMQWIVSSSLSWL